MARDPLNLYLVKFDAQYDEYRTFIVAESDAVRAHAQIYKWQETTKAAGESCDISWERHTETASIGTALPDATPGIIDSWFYYG